MPPSSPSCSRCGSPRSSPVSRRPPPSRPTAAASRPNCKRSLDNISTAQTKAYGQAEDFELGKPGIALNDVMVDLQKANVAFQTGLQVRNRLVAAYQEVMNLPA